VLGLVGLLPLVPLVALATACDLHAFNNDGGALNLAADGDRVAVALGKGGVSLLDGKTAARVAQAAPTGGADSIDDVTLADGWLFALDGDDGKLAVYDAKSLALVQDGVEVEVGPYTGIAARAGRVVVSGGTGPATVFRYDAAGKLTRERTIAGHRGTPDVALDRAGLGAFFSTHFEEPVDGHEFGLSSATFDGRLVDAVGLPGAGFTEGGGRPSSWPVRATVDNGRVYVAHGGGLSVVGYDAALDLTLTTTLDLQLRAVDVAVDRTTAWVVGVVPSALVEVDLTEPARPSVKKRTPLDGMPTAVAVNAGWILIAAGGAEPVAIAR
jgi:hypothetical protein